MDELKSMRAFVKVVEAGSFAEAARQAGVAKSVITKRVNQLEDHLQSKLLLRSTRAMSITDDGHSYYQRSVQLLNELDEAKASLHATDQTLSGRLRISCTSSFASYFIAKDLFEFQESHPNLEIEFLQRDRYCDPVQEGLDMALQVTGSVSANVEKKNILRVRRIIVATPEYLETYGDPKWPEDLVDHQLAHNTHVTPEFAIEFFRDTGVDAVKIKPQIQTNTIWLLRQAVLSGRYLALMPVFSVVDELISGELTPVLSSCEINATTMAAFYAKTPIQPTKTRLLLRFLMEKYGSTPPWERKLLSNMPHLAVALGRPPA
ncbi:MAG: LysR family transcriptional regulator [Pseudomonadota bacterium]